MPAACSMSKSIPLRPIWAAMVSSESPGPSMRVANRARNHHTPPRNPSGIRLEMSSPTKTSPAAAGYGPAPRRWSTPAARPRVSTVAAARHPPGHAGDVRQRARQADTLGDPAHHLPRHHGQPFTGGGDPLDGAVRQHPDRVEQPTVAHGGADLNRQGGDGGDPPPARVPGPMSRQTLAAFNTGDTGH